MQDGEDRGWNTPILALWKPCKVEGERNGVRVIQTFNHTVNPMLVDLDMDLPSPEDIFARMMVARIVTELDMQRLLRT